MKITRKQEIKMVSEIPIGAVFSGYVRDRSSCDDERLVYLRTHDRIINLSDPSDFWLVEEWMIVREYKEYDAEVTLKEKA